MLQNYKRRNAFLILLQKFLYGQKWIVHVGMLRWWVKQNIISVIIIIIIIMSREVLGVVPVLYPSR
jgi:hypothetical protein